MLYDGIKLAEGSSVSNMTIDSGTSFPTGADAGEMFYRTDENRPYMFNGTKWKLVRTEAGLTFPSDADLGDLFFKTDDQILYVYRSIGWTNSAPAYTLPAATALVLGGVKQGSGVSIAGDGTISAATGTSVADNNTFVKAQRGAVVALASSASVTPDFNASNNFSLTATSNFSLNFPTNVVAGQSGLIAITQDAVGSRAISFASGWVSAGGVKPVLSTAPNSVDYLTYYVESASRIFVSGVLAVA